MTVKQGILRVGATIGAALLLYVFLSGLLGALMWHQIQKASNYDKQLNALNTFYAPLTAIEEQSAFLSKLDSDYTAFWYRLFYGKGMEE